MQQEYKDEGLKWELIGFQDNAAVSAAQTSNTRKNNSTSSDFLKKVFCVYVVSMSLLVLERLRVIRYFIFKHVFVFKVLFTVLCLYGYV